MAENHSSTKPSPEMDQSSSSNNIQNEDLPDTTGSPSTLDSPTQNPKPLKVKKSKQKSDTPEPSAESAPTVALPGRPSTGSPQDHSLHRWQTPSAHDWEEATFERNPNCSYCLKSLGNKGNRCKDCFAKVHTDCMKLIPEDCFEKNVSPTDPTAGRDHFWREKSFEKKPRYCVACRKKVHQVTAKKSNPGLKCITCRAICHAECINNYQRRCSPCVVGAENCAKEFEHNFILGNVKGGCCVCNSHIGNRHMLAGFSCFWCKTKVCSYKCLDKLSTSPAIQRTCTGIKGFETLRIPPTYVYAPPGESDTSKWKIAPLPDNYRPLLAFVNPKSGGQLGVGIMNTLYPLINPLQVFDLTKGGPEPGLKLAMANPHINFILVACGGDGTAAWVFSIVDKLNMKCPPLAHCPLGTGNDLSRSLGWGPGMGDPTEIKDFISKMALKGVPVKLDRWKINIREKDANGEYEDKDVKVLNNYWSIGIDAKIALAFHETRNAKPKQFSNQTVNKIWYGKFGTMEMIDGCPAIQKQVTLEIDGVPISLKKDLEGFIVLNLPSCYGGACLWDSKPKDYSPQRINDDLLEVVGLKGSFHLGQCQAGISSPVVLGQGKVIRVLVNSALPVQLDGEPWMANPSEFVISRLNQATVLVRTDKAHPYVLKPSNAEPSVSTEDVDDAHPHESSTIDEDGKEQKSKTPKLELSKKKPDGKKPYANGESDGSLPSPKKKDKEKKEKEKKDKNLKPLKRSQESDHKDESKEESKEPKDKKEEKKEAKDKKKEEKDKKKEEKENKKEEKKDKGKADKKKSADEKAKKGEKDKPNTDSEKDDESSPKKTEETLNKTEEAPKKAEEAPKKAEEASKKDKEASKKDKDASKKDKDKKKDKKKAEAD